MGMLIKAQGHGLFYDLVTAAASSTFSSLFAVHRLTANSVNAAHFVFICLSFLPLANDAPSAQPFLDERRRSAANVLECCTLSNGQNRLSVTSSKVQQETGFQMAPQQEHKPR